MPSEKRKPYYSDRLLGKNGVNYTKGDLLCFSVAIEDLGEPGNKSDTDETNPAMCPDGGHPLPADDGCDKCVCADWYSITITDCGTGAEAYHVDGYIHGGNFQIHPLVGSSYHGPTCP